MSPKVAHDGGGALLACRVREELALDVEGRQIEDAEVAPAGADDRVRVVERREMAADERGHAGPGADPVAECRQEPAAVLRPFLGDRLPGDRVNEVASLLDERAGERDPLVHGQAARSPVGYGQADSEDAPPTPGAPRRAHRAGSAAGSHRRRRCDGCRAARESWRGQVAMGEVELENLDAKLGRATGCGDEVLANRRHAVLVQLPRDGAERAVGEGEADTSSQPSLSGTSIPKRRGRHAPRLPA